MHSDLNKDYFYAFVIPDARKHGAQNFFRRLHENFDSDNKALVIEENRSFFKNLLFLSKLSKNRKFNLVTTVNSNKLGLVFKIFHPWSSLVVRLGNTISQEIKKNTIKFFIHKFFYFLLIIFSKKIIFQSMVMKDDFINFFNFNNNEKFKVIHNGVSIPLPSPKKASSSMTSLDQSKTNFLLVGSFKHQKGYDIFFNALNDMSQELAKKIHFHICGDGEEYDYFYKILNNSHYKNNVTLHGEINPSTFYKDSNVYILPSRFEGFSNSLIEALGHGLPAVVANCPSANMEIIEENFNGVFFINQNSKDLLKKITYMVENHAQFNKGLIIQDVKNRFSIDVISSIYKELFI